MAQLPKQPKLWAMLIAQARAHFRIYPSPAASHWVHKSYVDKGGQFFDPVREKEPGRRPRADETKRDLDKAHAEARHEKEKDPNTSKEHKR